MSHTVARGEPFPAQLYLDGVLNEILKSKGKVPNVIERSRISIAQILFHCLKKNPSNVFMINGATGEVATNRQIFSQAVSLARTLIAKNLKGKKVTLLMRNHQRMTAMYFATLFADTLPFMQDPSSTTFELTHYLKLFEPNFVFCDEEHEDNLRTALGEIPELNTEVVVLQTEEHLLDFVKGYHDDLEGFILRKLLDKEPDSTAMLLPTSGSTGLPKAAMMSQQGLIAQLPCPWSNHTDFPRPTELMMVLTTLQWMTFTMMITSGVVYQVPLLISPRLPTVDNVKEMLIKFRPTWTFFGPAFVKTLLPEITPDHFSSLKTLKLLGAPCTIELMTAIQEKLPGTSHLFNAYGSTETQGHIALPDITAPLSSNGKVFNIYQYKLIDSNGKEVGLRHNGELYLKGISCIQGYYKNDEAYNEAFTNGWYKTGDLFYIDEMERLFYLERIKFNFKFMGCQVAPEEIESIITAVPGVQECVVCGTDNGPTAAVVVQPNCEVTRDQIHKAVDATLSEHKRLCGGIAFISSLPYTSTGKLKRTECKKLIKQLIKTGECC